jgi:guanine nucleotide-binding protein subunit alpha
MYGEGFSCEETEGYRIRIFNNMIHGLKDILDSFPDFSTALSPENQPNADLLATARDIEYFVSFPAYLCEPLRKLWKDPACETWRKRNNDALKCACL